MNYTDLEAELHEVFWEEEGPPAELPLLRAFYDLRPGKALEIGCGSGRLLLPLLTEGREIEGLDYSPDMVRLVTESAHNEGLEPTIHQLDMDHFDLGTYYSSISIPSFSVQIAKDPQRVFENVKRHLEPGGGFYLSFFIPWAEIVGELEEGEWYDDNAHAFEDGRSAFCKTRMTIDRVGQLLTREHHYKVYDGNDKLLREQETTQNLKWFWRQETTLMLEKAGFNVDQIVPDFSLEYDPDEVPHVLSFFCTAT